VGDKKPKPKRDRKSEPVVERITPPRLKVVPGSQFKRDLKKLNPGGKDLAKLQKVIDALRDRKPLAAAHCDHALKGELVGYRDCHIQGDWVLIYVCTDTELRLYRTGSHSQLGI
jgi:mRNA interferase YafQ